MFTLKKKKNKPFVILHLTDLQIIDPHQKCAPDRLNDEATKLFEDLDACAFNQVRKLVKMVKPDWIIHTGDQVYGEFDGNGSVFKRFVKLMESFKIPWSFANGNHDGEESINWNNDIFKCGKGYQWQSDYIKTHTKYCLYEQGNKKMGFGNYCIKLKEDKKTVWSFVIMDSHGTRGFEKLGINAHQTKWLSKVFDNLNKSGPINNFMFYHIANYEFKLASQKYYGNEICTITTDGSKNERGDFGENKEKICFFENETFWNLLKNKGHTKAVFVGHNHINNSSIEYEGIRLTFGTKAGIYDYHQQQGGNKITISDDGYDIEQILL